MNEKIFDKLIDIILGLLEKIIPDVINKFIPKVKVQPKKINFLGGDWDSRCSFFIQNRSKEVIFDTYIGIKIIGGTTEDIDIKLQNGIENLSINISSVQLNYQVCRFNLFLDDEELILLKIDRLHPGSILSFEIKNAKTSTIELKFLEYSKEETQKLSKENGQVAISFKIPKNLFKKKGDPKLKSLNMVLKKEN